MRRVSKRNFSGCEQSDHEVSECVLDECKRQLLMKRTQTCPLDGNNVQEGRITVFRPRRCIMLDGN
jgi:hypothetical protein